MINVIAEFNDDVCVGGLVVGKLLEMHGEGSSTTTTHGKASEVGERVDRPDNYEPPVLSSV